MSNTKRQIAVIGAGPVGLAAAAHLLERGETPLVLEAGAAVGANIRDWAHVRMFSPWEFTVDAASGRLLEANGWQMPPADELPTGGDLVERYLAPLAALLKDYIQLNTRVTAVSRRRVDKMKDKGRDDTPFVINLEYADGREEQIEAAAVIDASGTWHNPNPLGASGLPALGEKRHQAHITYGIPDVLDTHQQRFANQRVMVVGSGHSAINVLLNLVELKRTQPQTQIYWVMRTTNLQQVYGGKEDDALPARGALGSRIQQAVQAGDVTIVAPFYVQAIEGAADGGLYVTSDAEGDTSSLTVDEIIAATGARPDLDMLREVRLNIDSSLESAGTLAPMIDPNIHSCGTVPPHGEAELRHPEAGFYIVGMKSYGRAPTFLLATGYEQVRSVVAGLVGDWEAAKDVQLCLPETGVCSTDFASDGDACCSPAQATVDLGTIAVRS